MWSSPTSVRQVNYVLPPEMGTFVVAPSNHPLDHSVAANATASAVGVIPLLTATPCLNLEDDLLNNNRGGCRSTNINSTQFWQQHSYPKKVSDHGFLQGGGGGAAAGSTSTSGSTMTCQDCGNQAKKDCSHRRCRTCCKSRGFDCSTHVKSTWVPAARRRERQLMASNPAAAAAGSSASTSVAKKPRLSSHTTTASHTSTSNTTPPRSFDTSSSHHHQDGSYMESLPGQVRAPAVFKCVRVTAVDDGDDEYAYQASVRIGGHVFKGFLYDQGLERDQTIFPNLSELHLGGATRLEPTPVYGPSSAAAGALLGGSTYANHTS